jgi:hypothetical protein
MQPSLTTCVSAIAIQETKNLPVIPFGLTSIDSALPSGGLIRGALHEFLYYDPLEPHAVACTIPALLAYNAHAALVSHTQRSQWGSSLNSQIQHSGSQQRRSMLAHTLWIGKRAWPSPPALAGLTSNYASLSKSFFEHSLFIDPPNDSAALWAIDLALRSSAIDVIVAACPSISRTTTQRLSLAAKKYGTTAILLRSHSDYATPSCASSRWSIAPTPSSHEAPSWRLSLAKLRGGLLIHSEWIVSMYAADLFQASTHALSAAKNCEQSTPVALSDYSEISQRSRAHVFM